MDATPEILSNQTRPPATAWVWAVLELVRRDLKVRYKNSALGVFWSFLNPAMQVVILTVVFKYIMGSTVKNYSVELFTCLLPWMFFAQGLGDGAVCTAKDALLIHKYAFPRILLPIASIASNFVHLLLGFVVLGVIFAILHVNVNLGFLWVVPLLAIQTTLTLGLVLMFATLHMYYEDIRFILASVIQLMFFLSPILYTMDHVMNTSKLSPMWQELYMMLNPLTPLLIGYRAALLHGSQWPVPDYFKYVACSLGWALLALAIGLILWRRHAWRFSEMG